MTLPQRDLRRGQRSASSAPRSCGRLGRERCIGLGDAAPDLRDAAAVDEFFARERPDAVFLLGGRSGGIARNQREPAELMLDNLRMQTAVIPAAHRHGVAKLRVPRRGVHLPARVRAADASRSARHGPRRADQRGRTRWRSGPGLVLCRAFAQEHGARFVTAIPANPFGPGDDTRSEDAHVVGALMRRMHEAKLRRDAEVVVWGTGRARRDFLYVDDLADALPSCSSATTDAATPINVSGGSDVAIAELAERIQKVVGFAGRLRLRRLAARRRTAQDARRQRARALGWRPRASLDEALAETYRWMLAAEAAR